MQREYIIFLFSFFLSSSIFAQNVIIDRKAEIVNVGRNMLLLEDKSKQVSMDDLLLEPFQEQFVPAQSDVPALATTTAAVWVKIPVQSLVEEKCFLQLTNPSIDSIEFYAFDIHNKLVKQKQFSTANYHAIKEIQSASFIFELPTNTQHVYLRLLDDETLMLDIKIGTLQALFAYNDQRVWWNALYFGIVFVMLIYNFFLFINIQDISYLYYVGFSLTFALAYSHTQGFTAYLVGNYLDSWIRQYATIISCISIALGNIFAIHFLQLRKYYPWVVKVVWGVVIWSGINVILFLLGYKRLSFISLQLSALLPVYIYLAVAFLIYRKGYKPALFYFVAFVGLEIGLTAHILVGKGVIPYFSTIADYFLHLGSAWELIVLSFALAYKINLLKAEKEKVQSENLRLVQEQNQILETKINERTSKLNSVIEELNQINEQLNQTVIVTKIQKEEISNQAEELKIANEKMQELDTFKEGLTSMIVHDLKNPLNTILGLGERKEVIQAGKQMLNMVLNILDVQKFEKAQFGLNLADYRLQNIVRQALSEVKLLIERKSLTVESLISPSLYVKADFEIMARVLVNILTNAIKFSPNNSKIMLSSTLKEVSPPANFVLLAITDQGEGIAPDKIPHIFDKFSQVKERKSGEVRSTGLGLTFCKMAVEAHGGVIDVISKPHQGATFWLTLPQGVSVVESAKSELIVENAMEISLSYASQTYLLPYLSELRKFTVYEYSDVKNILDQVTPYNQEIILWKRHLENALRACNEEKYRELLMPC
ncbi:MAG: 7TM diverse intracellular signaling domain-containing protein [Thermoflexibacter sp.]